eukprot:Opistho-1_new@22931
MVVAQVAEREGFLGRWARRKADVREGKPLAEPVVAVPEPMAQAPVAVVADTPVSDAPGEATPEPALPTLDDALALTPSSDFKPFMAQGVTPEVKNAAMKQLFTDPHYNVMDGLDTYIDDYSKPDPIPESMLRNMVSAQFLKLFEEEEKDADVAKATGPVRDDAYDPAVQSVAQSYAPTDIATPEPANGTPCTLR